MKRRLSVENRMLIEQLLRLNYKLKDIAYYVDSTSSTVSREIKNRRITGKGDFKECNKTKRFPYVCNGCNIKTYCRKKKYYYNYLQSFLDRYPLEGTLLNAVLFHPHDLPSKNKKSFLHSLHKKISSVYYKYFYREKKIDLRVEIL